MRVERKSIATMSMPYAVATVRLGGRVRTVAATEDHGKTIISSPPDWEAQEMLAEPGGCMSVAQPAGSERLFAIYGCFPGYQFHHAAVYEILPKEGGQASDLRSIFPLPFAHRICFATRKGTEYLISANLARTKKSPDDWADPGAVHAAVVPDSPEGEWVQESILGELHKNHCMYSGILQGRRVLMIGGAEGLFSFDLDADEEGWEARPILNHEISEVVAIDLNGDGFEELVTIEPFHGNQLVVYRRDGTAWSRVGEYSLEYGHGVCGGLVNGKRVLVVGNRAGDGNLELFIPEVTADLRLTRRVVAGGVGAANVALVEHEGESWIVAANQRESEVVAYRIESL